MVVFGLIFVVVGLALLIYGVRVQLRYRAFLQRARHTEGIVVEKKRRHKLRDLPIVEFSTEQGERVRASQYLSAWPMQISVDDRVRVYYDASNPKDPIALRGDFAQWVGTIVSGAFGLLVFLLGALIVYGSITGQV